MKAALLALALTACGGPGPTAHDVVTAAVNPLTTARKLAPERWHAQVIERVDAGSYMYLQVTHDGAPRWVATFAGRPQVGDEVDVTSFAELDRFRSARTGRTFEHLQFASVRLDDAVARTEDAAQVHSTP